MKGNNMLYHWYEEPDYCRIKLKKDYQKNLVEYALEKERLSRGSTRTLANKIGVHIRTIFRWQSLESRTFYIKDLKSLCKYLQISYNKLENQKAIECIGNSLIKSKGTLITNPKFPFKLLNKEMAELVGYVVSDGCISSSQCNFIYVSNDIKQIERVKLLLNKICGNVKYRKEREKSSSITVVFPPTIGRVLIKVGLLSGEKSINDSNIPGWIKNIGPKEYLRAVFTDEGHSRLRTIKTKRHKFWSLQLNVTHGRSRDIASELSKSDKQLLKQEIKQSSYVSYKKLPQSIISKLERISPPKFLLDEEDTLNELGIKSTKIRPMKIWRTKKDKFTCYWRFSILKESVTNFYKKVNFTSRTKKQKRFELQFKKFIKFWKTSLTDEDLIKYHLPRG